MSGFRVKRSPHTSGMLIVSKASSVLSRSSAVGKGVANGLYARISFAMSARPIWNIPDRRSLTTPEVEVGQRLRGQKDEE